MAKELSASLVVLLDFAAGTLRRNSLFVRMAAYPNLEGRQYEYAEDALTIRERLRRAVPENDRGLLFRHLLDDAIDEIAVVRRRSGSGRWEAQSPEGSRVPLPEDGGQDAPRCA